MTDPTPARSWLRRPIDLIVARRVARERRWLDRRQYPNYGESSMR